MKLFWIPAAMAMAFVLWLSSGVPSSVGAEDDEAAAEDFQDLVFFGDHAPVLLRLHIRIDDKPFPVVWEEAIESLFKYLDRNGDGVLSKEEAERAPQRQRLLQQVRTGNFVVAPGGTANMIDLDTDPEDGKVTLEELRKYYRVDFGPAELTFAPVRDIASDLLTDALFTHLDKNKDGKLSKDELALAPSVLQILDIDDDEMISVQELLPYPGAGVQNQVEVGGQGRPAAGADVAAIAMIDRSDATNRLRVAEQMIRRYDRDKNQKLSRSEVGIEKSVFEKLDLNHDGELEVTELMRYLRRPPDCELIFRLGKKAGKEPRAAAYNPEGRPRALNFEVRPAGEGALMLNAGGAQLKFVCDPRTLPDSNLQQFNRFFLRAFRDADSGGKGYLVMKDLEKQPFQQLKLLFPFADRDGDGKLTEKELVAYLELQAKLIAGYSSLGATDQGRGLFEAMDANHDGKLGVRELRTAWSRLAAYDRDGDGCIDKTEIPGQFLITVSRGRAQFNGRPAFGGPAMTYQAPAPTRGPLWFRKMDRNGDGDVSRREFLGKPEDFDRIDADHDGLISAEEAEKADAWYRSQVSTKGTKKHEKKQ